MVRFRHFAALVLTAALLAGCGGSERVIGNEPEQAKDADTMLVAAALYPIAAMVDAIGGTYVKVMNLTPPGTDAHGVELSAQQLESLQDAKITFYLGQNYQPTVQKSIESLKASSIDLLDSVQLLTMAQGAHSDDDHDDHSSTGAEKDPHVWLDPAYMIDMARAIADALSQAKPKYSATFASNATKYIDELEVLGNEIDTRFATCSSRTIITAHYSFGYFAKRANLTVYSVANLNPDEQLSAKKLEELATLVREAKVSTVFYEELVSTELAKTLAEQAGITTDILHPLEGMSQKDLDAGKTYYSVQRENINKIATSLSCS